MRNNLQKYISYILLALTNLILISCNQSEEPLVYNPDLVFTNSLKINVEPYSYSDFESSEYYWIYGDSALVVDTVGSTPEFQWAKVLSSLTTLVISREHFQVVDNKITNASQIIWQWQPGMEGGEIGKVAFFDGKTVKNENILYDTQPLPLQSGLYYWAVWAWESSGREIIYSSKPHKIYVK